MALFISARAMVWLKKNFRARKSELSTHATTRLMSTEGLAQAVFKNGDRISDLPGYMGVGHLRV